jgi:hypothetical protein
MIMMAPPRFRVIPSYMKQNIATITLEIEERTAKKISLVKLIVSYKKNIDKLEIMIKRQNYLRFVKQS